MELIKNNKKLVIEILVFVIVFIFSLLISYIINPIWGDYVWSYGFSQKISKGLIIYRDFNAVPMPLYFILASVFIKSFGNYFIVTNIFDSLLIATIGLILYKNNKLQGIIPLLILQIVTPSPYNILCLALLFIIVHLISNKDYNEYLIAYLVGLIFITKQNVGILLFIPMFFYSKHKIKSTLLFLVPFIILCIFFFINNSLFQFIDYTLIGLIAFKNNSHIIPMFIIIQIICSIYLLYHLIKSKFQDKEAFFILAFQLISYPLFEVVHFTPAFVIFLYYFIKHNNMKILKAIIYTSLLLYFSTAYYIHVTPIQVNTKKDILFLKSPANITDYLEQLYNYFDKDLSNVYFAFETSYLIKLYYNLPINEFDLNNDANWGYFSNKKIEDDFIKQCKKNNCKFVITDKIKKHYQIKNINRILNDNFEIIGKIDFQDDLVVYGNKSEK